MKWEEVTLPDVTLIGKSINTSNEDNKALIDIRKMWETTNLAELYKQAGAPPEAPLYVSYYDYKGDFTQPYRFMIGLKTSEDVTAPRGYTQLKVPRATYLPYMR